MRESVCVSERERERVCARESMCESVSEFYSCHLFYSCHGNGRETCVCV